MLFEIHCHSSFSDGSSSPQAIIAYAKTFLDGIAITDHDEIEGSLEAMENATNDFTVIPGMEVSSSDGHILALYVTEKVRRDLSAKDTVDAIHTLGGIAIAAHPFDKVRNGVGDLVLDVDFDAIEVVNGHTFKNTKDPMRVCMEHGLSMVGGSDAHLLREVGSVKVEFTSDLRDSISKKSVKVRANPLINRWGNNMLSIINHKTKKILGKRR